MFCPNQGLGSKINFLKLFRGLTVSQELGSRFPHFCSLLPTLSPLHLSDTWLSWYDQFLSPLGWHSTFTNTKATCCVAPDLVSNCSSPDCVSFYHSVLVLPFLDKFLQEKEPRSRPKCTKKAPYCPMSWNVFPLLTPKAAWHVYVAEIVHLWQRQGSQQLLPKATMEVSG